MSVHYNLPLHSQNGDDYVIDDGYPHDGVTPPGMSWDGQSDGGGKFRLKRRRRCGQCGPCQVKENCNKCQYCMRKDVLKQACVYRKCVYLRKPVPRFRQEPASAGGASHKLAPTPPHKTTTTPVPSIPVSSVSSSTTNSSTTNNGTANSGSNCTTPGPNSSISSPTSVGPPTSHTAELSSCRLNQSPFATLSAMQSMNNGALDPLRQRMMEQPHRSLYESMNHQSSLDQSRSAIDSSKPVMADVSRFTGVPAPPSLNAHCKLDQVATVVSHANSMNPAVASSLNSMNSALGGQHPHHQSSKCPSSLPSRDPYFPSMDTWSSMPYALPHTTAWATPALPNHHVAAATYGFQQHSTPFQSSFSPSSCRLGMPDPAASRFISPAGAQHSFHHSMAMAGFSQDFSHATSNHATHANIRASMNPSFYPPPPHISPTSIHTFPGLGQFSASQAGFGPAAYSMHPHAHMYPGSFYSFRTATEPQIYHVQVYPSHNPFKHSLLQMPLFFQGEKGMGLKSNTFELSILGEKEFGLDFLDRQHLEVISSDTIQPTLSAKDFVVSCSFSSVLRTECLKYDSLEGSLSHNSSSPCNFDSVEDKHELLEGSDGKGIACYTQNKKKAILAKTLSDSSYSRKDAVTQDDESSSANIVFKTGSNGIRTESSLLSDSIDLDLQDHLTWTYHSVECDKFLCENDEFSFLSCGRTKEQSSDISSDSDDGDDEKVICLQTKERRPVSSDSSSFLSSLSCMNMRSVATVSQTKFSPAFLIPAASSSSSLLASADETRDLSSEEDRKYVCAKESSNCQSLCVLSATCQQNWHLNVQTRAQNSYKRKLPFLELKKKYLRKKRILHLRKPCRQMPSETSLSSQTSIFGSFSLPSFTHQTSHQHQCFEPVSDENQILNELSPTDSSSHLMPLPSRNSPSPSL